MFGKPFRFYFEHDSQETCFRYHYELRNKMNHCKCTNCYEGDE